MLRLLALSTTALVALSALPAAAQNIVSTADGDVVTVIDTDVIDVTGVAAKIEGDVSTLNNDGLLISQDNDAVDATGSDFVLNNGVTGVIVGENRGVRVRGDNSTVINDGSITAVGNDAVDANVDGFSLFNTGVITTDDETGGRGVQARGDGVYIENTGVISAWDETIEARENFTLFNGGDIINTGEEDAVQFATGTVVNEGDIIGGDDGIDFDDGVITNYGLIKSRSTESDAAAIDFDPIIENADGSTEAALKVEVENFGEIIGFVAIGADDEATSEVVIYNEGLIEGAGLNANGRTTAMKFAPDQGETEITLALGSTVIGDIALGGSDDALALMALENGGDALGGGIAFGGAGDDALVADMDLLSLVLFANVFRADYVTAFGDRGFIRFAGFESVTFANAFFDEDALAAIVPIPLPAAGWLLLAGLGGMVALRRRA